MEIDIFPILLLEYIIHNICHRGRHLILARQQRGVEHGGEITEIPHFSNRVPCMLQCVNWLTNMVKCPILYFVLKTGCYCVTSVLLFLNGVLLR